MELRLYHYTCDHGAAGIERDGFLRPNPYSTRQVGFPVVWMTDLRPPFPARALGFDPLTNSCDRLAHCYEVNPTDAMRWGRLRSRVLRERPDLEAQINTLEEFAMPAHWWVGLDQVRVLRRA